MSEKLILLTSSSPVKAGAIAAYFESTGVFCYLQNASLDQSDDEGVTNILVKETDYHKSVNLLNSFQPDETRSSHDTIDQQAFPGLFVIPVDFSPAAEQACYYALELATKFKARIKLIHTYGVPDFRPFAMEEGDFYQSTLNSQYNDIKEQLDEKINELGQKLNKYIAAKSLTEVPITKTMLHGLPDEITLYSSEVDEASLIIMGISGENSLSFGAAGKVASRIVEKSKVPVLIIPEDNKFEGIDKLRNILYLTTFDESDFSAIQKLIATAKNINLKIFCLHIERGTIDPWDKIKMNGLREYFKSSYNLNTVFCDLVSSDNMIQALDEFIASHDIDIIAVINHKRNALSKLINPGITKKILFHTRIPLLVFHD